MLCVAAAVCFPAHGLRRVRRKRDNQSVRCRGVPAPSAVPSVWGRVGEEIRMFVIRGVD